MTHSSHQPHICESFASHSLHMLQTLHGFMLCVIWRTGEERELTLLPTDGTVTMRF